MTAAACPDPLNVCETPLLITAISEEDNGLLAVNSALSYTPAVAQIPQLQSTPPPMDVKVLVAG